MTDFQDGPKKDVAEIKFLIHDLRVEKFINDVIHFHVTLNTDLEIYDVEHVAQIHGEDLLELKSKGQSQRRALQIYSNAVKHFSPPETIISAGNEYIGTIQDICELIINPLWGRFEKVMSFLPHDSRSFRSVNHYRNCLRWICGVYYRIEHFMDEEGGRGGAAQDFDLGHDVEDFTRNVIRGYVTEKSSSRVDIYFDRIDSAMVSGNRNRFRRMLFNLVMNSVDAMSDQVVGELRLSVVRQGLERVRLVVTDNGGGMTEEKREQLLTDRDTLDGELHSLGFVFVRNTVRDFGGELVIKSELGQGTTVNVTLPYFPNRKSPPRRKSRCEKFRMIYDEEQGLVARTSPSNPAVGEKPPENGEESYGRLLLEDFQTSQALYRGSIFFISVTEEGRVDFFPHQPYEKGVELGHEDLSPIYYEAAVRGRLEENSRREPMLILKTPYSVRDYFEFKGLPEDRFSAEAFNRMVHDEYIRIARILAATGLPPVTPVQLTDLARFLPDLEDRFHSDPIPLALLAEERLETES